VVLQAEKFNVSSGSVAEVQAPESGISAQNRLTVSERPIRDLREIVSTNKNGSQNDCRKYA
jgi:hypothetical protein